MSRIQITNTSPRPASLVAVPDSIGTDQKAPAVDYSPAEKKNLGGRPTGAFGEDSLAERIHKLDVGESVSSAKRLPLNGKKESENIYAGMSASLGSGARRVAGVKPGFEQVLERGQFKTRAGHTMLVVVLTRTA